MKTQLLVQLVVIVLILPPAAWAQRVRIPTDAPIAFAQCNGKALHEYQVEQTVQFIRDSTIAVAPTDTVGEGHIVQFVVDSTGRAIPESLYPITTPTELQIADMRRDLPRWRFRPALIGGRPACQVFTTSLRGSGRFSNRPSNER